MNVYDFDGTIYDGDCTIDLYKYCLVRRPYLVVCLPWQIAARYGFKRGKIDRAAMKQGYYTFFRLVDIEKMSRRFWDKNMDKIFPWYLEHHNDDDVVITASPDFHVREACSRLGITHVIASDVDPKSGRCLGPNCRDKEKVRRFREVFGDAHVDEFYSDMIHDYPMAELADRAFLVVDGKVMDWPVTDDGQILK